MTKNKKILFFGSHLAFHAGGAELSMSAIIKKLENNHISIFSFDFSDSYKVNNKYKSQFLPHNNFLFSYLPYLSFFLNRNCFNKINNNYNEVHVYTRFGVYLIKKLYKKNKKCKFYFYIRSVTDFGVNINLSDKLFFRFLKIIISFLEYPFKKFYLNHLRSISKYTIYISNSKYTKNYLFNSLGLKSKIIYPALDLASINSHFHNTRTKRSYIKFVGDSEWKGLSLIMELAILFPNEKFIIYTRKISNCFRKDNIEYRPWTSDRAKLFSNVKVFLVPSQIPESYGRVSSEAYTLGIPVLVSNIGALPETVRFNKKFIVNNYNSIIDWKISLERYLCVE